MKKRKHARKKKAASPTRSHAPINVDKYLKNKVLVFKLRKKIKHELKADKQELNNLVRLVRRARKFAA